MFLNVTLVLKLFKEAALAEKKKNHRGKKFPQRHVPSLRRHDSRSSLIDHLEILIYFTNCFP